jgi:hypothetical protein
MSGGYDRSRPVLELFIRSRNARGGSYRRRYCDTKPGRVMDRLILHERWLSSLDAKAPPAHTIDVTSGANQPGISSTERRRYASDWSQNRGIG